MHSLDRRTGRHVHWQLLLVPCLLLSCEFGAQGAAPGAPQDGQGRLPNAVMLKRIAEAIDGDRSGGLVYVVESLEETFPVIGVFPDLKTAKAAAAAARVKVAVSGPYPTMVDPTHGILSACVHDRLGSNVHVNRCTPPVSGIDLTDITLVLTHVGGRSDTLKLSPDADAIFLSMAAIDKFAIPYYVRSIGIADANAMRDNFERVFLTGKKP